MNGVAAALFVLLSAALCPLSVGPVPAAGTSLAVSPSGSGLRHPIRPLDAAGCQLPQGGLDEDDGPPDGSDECGPDGSCDGPIEI